MAGCFAYPGGAGIQTGGVNGRISWWRLALCIAVTEGAGGIGSIFTFSEIGSWYAGLVKSPITPPNWLFGPMWISLYFLMGLALYMAWVGRGRSQWGGTALALFGIQLFLNVLWSVIFFGLHELLFGFVEIIFLWFFIAATIVEFREIDRRAGYLLLPYIAWVTAATLLNLSIVWLNPLA